MRYFVVPNPRTRATHARSDGASFHFYGDAVSRQVTAARQGETPGTDEAWSREVLGCTNPMTGVGGRTLGINDLTI
jgi:hypothetical protein